ncbi:unnamed protein product [Rotaria socialis]|uniref:G-protein coupled receptors family 1 profile domain-containing protein n=1 Tax=Rotaria socialis TaxID=392032 RepID=A0A821T0K7_9BILA|nr:unnamed protein product [Rotaria socialis]CAF4864990.1 unnamed protein product [Rotaria socialis]
MDISFYLNYTRTGNIWPQTPVSCLFWWLAATDISNMINILMAWTSIGRHILVFHERWLLTKKERFFIHYFPLLAIALYGFIYYIVILFIYSRDNMYAFTDNWCLFPCYYYDENLAMYDTVVNSIIPTPIITIFSIGLIIRVIKRKQNHHRSIEWRNCRRITLQRVSISAMFLLLNLPMPGTVLAQVCGLLNGAA